ncbi:MAG: 4-hydroxy-tetrahydrodipicolinate synthase [Pseudomonadota bacterium]
MERKMMSGVWIPLVTPFQDGEVDLASYRKLVDYYIKTGASGLFPLGTTGEAPTLDDSETDKIIAATLEVANGAVPVFVGAGGNATTKVVRQIERLSQFEFQGFVSVCPYYNRPTQDGMREHFTAIAGATDRDVLIYNIPYRTSVNLANKTLLELAEIPNIVGVKDSSGLILQSLELLALSPPGFSVLTGEDPMFFTSLCNGADGGILAAAHIAPERYIRIAELIVANDVAGARAIWRPLQQFIPKLFQEANPIPVKYCLWRQGLIASPECRLPLSKISDGLAQELDEWLADVG